MNFAKTLIGNATMSIDGQDVGIIKGPLKIKRTVESARMEVGTPVRLVGEVVNKETFTIEAPLAQFDANTLALTVANVDLIEFDGDPIAESIYEATFAPGTNSSLDRILARGPNLSDYRIEVSQDPVVPAVEGVDYVVDTVRGVFYRIPGGGIDPGATVMVAYSYAPPASTRIPIGTTSAFKDAPLEVNWTSPINQERMRIIMHRAKGDGNLEFSFSDGEFQVLNLRIEAMDDSANHPDSPLGSIDLLPAETP